MAACTMLVRVVSGIGPERGAGPRGVIEVKA
jgi:hypothetical protein